MATQTIVDASLVPANPAAPAGAQVTLISYQVSGSAIHVVMLPTSTPSLDQVKTAIQADVTFRNQFKGQTVTTS